MPSLNWIGRQAVINHYKEMPYHLLDTKKELSYNIEEAEGNIIVHGDNLVALKSLLPYYSKSAKFCYIDVPYNTGNEEWIYNDNVNDPQIRKWLGQVVGKELDDLSRHDKWLCMMYPRLQLLKKFLRDDGFICVQIDDSEGAHLRVMMDEIFHSSNYLATIYVQVRYADKTLKQDMNFHKQIEQILVYRRTPKAKPYMKSEEYSYDKFTYTIKEKAEGREIELGGKRVVIFNPGEYEIINKEEGFKEGLKEIWASGTILDGNSSGRFFRDYLTGRKEGDGLGVLYKVYGIGEDMYDYRYFTGPKRSNATKGKYYQGVPLDKMSDDAESIKSIPNFYDMAADFGNCRHEGGVEFKSGKKPEKLLATLMEYFTREDDVVIDSFSGSGTTAAVAHKMKRKWIAIEMGDHCYTHVQKRLLSVVKGTDSQFNWNGGGGFRFYELSVPLTDRYGQINKSVSYEHLARHIYFTETGHSVSEDDLLEKPLIAEFRNTFYFLLFENDQETVLDNDILAEIKKYNGTKIVYADRNVISSTHLKAHDIMFKQIPYQVEVK
ncbi:site-specific DNA-methyltransferase [Clostridium formicaceticum]|uniref:Modification methylase BamHI n=1 Tax=Clostridium formicaceticum TaxID=1497 RepID=A0AAC9RLI2_9CLOT|nr:site-specific DNA-methyltransferase [Clostridium formicaceticum]AOY75005.1 hypothetical protein BJL90_02930 [Clostridium formicaceticum]ARE89421.1 Modification methylase BamHI [Clostridium formicaceticum]